MKVLNKSELDTLILNIRRYHNPSLWTIDSDPITRIHPLQYHPKHRGEAELYKGWYSIFAPNEVFRGIRPGSGDILGIAIAPSQYSEVRAAFDAASSELRFIENIESRYNAMYWQTTYHHESMVSGDTWYSCPNVKENMLMPIDEQQWIVDLNKSEIEKAILEDSAASNDYNLTYFSLGLRYKEIHYLRREYSDIVYAWLSLSGSRLRQFYGSNCTRHTIGQFNDNSELFSEYRRIKLPSTGRELLMKARQFGFSWVELQPVANFI